jgi:hypothetical protein
MPTYTDQDALKAYAAAVGYADRLPPDADLDQLIEQAEGDVDRIAFAALPLNATLGLPKMPAADLYAEEQAALGQATCAQAVYRLEMGPEHFVRAQREKVTGRAFSAEGKLPILGPEASRLLAAAGLFRVTTAVGHRGASSRRWQAE